MKINNKEINKRITNLKTELAHLESLVKQNNRAPKKIPYSIDELADRIHNDTLEDDLVVGDYIDFDLYTGETVRAIVIGVQHDELKNGELADYTFGILCIDMRFKMNDEHTNKTGWTDCKYRETYIPRIMKLLPAALQEHILPVKKLTSAGNCSKKIVASVDKLFCFSEVEIFGETEYSCEGEGKQYPYFSEKEHREIPNYPWLRSPGSNGSSYFCSVYGSGGADYGSAGYTRGVALGFCLSSSNR